MIAAIAMLTISWVALAIQATILYRRATFAERGRQHAWDRIRNLEIERDLLRERLTVMERAMPREFAPDGVRRNRSPLLPPEAEATEASTASPREGCS